MPRKPSPHAMTIVALINNAADLTVKHHDYELARDVMRATKKICAEFGFEIDEEVFGYIISSIGRKSPLAMSEDFAKLAMTVDSLDKKLDKEPIANDVRKS